MERDRFTVSGEGVAGEAERGVIVAVALAGLGGIGPGLLVGDADVLHDVACVGGRARHELAVGVAHELAVGGDRVARAVAGNDPALDEVLRVIVGTPGGVQRHVTRRHVIEGLSPIHHGGEDLAGDGVATREGAYSRKGVLRLDALEVRDDRGGIDAGHVLAVRPALERVAATRDLRGGQRVALVGVELDRRGRGAQVGDARIADVVRDGELLGREVQHELGGAVAGDDRARLGRKGLSPNCHDAVLGGDRVAIRDVDVTRDAQPGFVGAIDDGAVDGIGPSLFVGRADVLDAMGGVGGRAADEHAVGVAHELAVGRESVTDTIAGDGPALDRVPRVVIRIPDGIEGLSPCRHLVARGDEDIGLAVSRRGDRDPVSTAVGSIVAGNGSQLAGLHLRGEALDVVTQTGIGIGGRPTHERVARAADVGVGRQIEARLGEMLGVPGETGVPRATARLELQLELLREVVERDAHGAVGRDGLRGGAGLRRRAVVAVAGEVAVVACVARRRVERQRRVLLVGHAAEGLGDGGLGGGVALPADVLDRVDRVIVGAPDGIKGLSPTSHREDLEEVLEGVLDVSVGVTRKRSARLVGPDERRDADPARVGTKTNERIPEVLRGLALGSRRSRIGRPAHERVARAARGQVTEHHVLRLGVVADGLDGAAVGAARVNPGAHVAEVELEIEAHREVPEREPRRAIGVDVAVRAGRNRLGDVAGANVGLARAGSQEAVALGNGDVEVSDAVLVLGLGGVEAHLGIGVALVDDRVELNPIAMTGEFPAIDRVVDELGRPHGAQGDVAGRREIGEVGAVLEEELEVGALAGVLALEPGDNLLGRVTHRVIYGVCPLLVSDGPAEEVVARARRRGNVTQIEAVVGVVLLRDVVGVLGRVERTAGDSAERAGLEADRVLVGAIEQVEDRLAIGADGLHGVGRARGTRNGEARVVEQVGVAGNGAHVAADGIEVEDDVGLAVVVGDTPGGIGGIGGIGARVGRASDEGTVVVAAHGAIGIERREGAVTGDEPVLDVVDDVAARRPDRVERLVGNGHEVSRAVDVVERASGGVCPQRAKPSDDGLGLGTQGVGDALDRDGRGIIRRDDVAISVNTVAGDGRPTLEHVARAAHGELLAIGGFGQLEGVVGTMGDVS